MTTAFQVRLAMRGRLDDYIKAEAERSAKAATAGMRIAARGLEKDLESAYAGASLGRLARAWASRVYPGRGVSQSPVGWVYPKGGARTQKAIEAHGAGAVIRAKHRRFLAIPTPAAPKKGIGGQRLSPMNWPEYTYGPLRYVKRPGRPDLLVVDNVRATATGIRRLTAIRRKGQVVGTSLRGRATAVMFVLVPMVRLRRRVNVTAFARSWAARVPEFIAGEFEKLPPPSV